MFVRWTYLIQEHPTVFHQKRMEKFSSARLYMILASLSDQWNWVWWSSCSADLDDLATALLPTYHVILLFSSTDQCELNNHRWTITAEQSPPQCHPVVAHCGLESCGVSAAGAYSDFGQWPTIWVSLEHRLFSWVPKWKPDPFNVANLREEQPFVLACL